MPYTRPISALLAYLLLVACQTPGQLVDLPHIKNRERSPPRISQCRLSTDAKYTEVFAFSKFHTNIQKYLHLCNKGKGFALRHRLPLQMAVELAPGPGPRVLASRPGGSSLGSSPAGPSPGQASTQSGLCSLRIEPCGSGNPSHPMAFGTRHGA